MNNVDFQFAPNFSFSSPSPSTNTSRSRPRLAKLRKSRSSFSQQGAPYRNDGAGGGKSFSVFGWSSDTLNSVAGGCKNDADDGSTFSSTNGGKANQEFMVSDESSSTPLTNEFEKLNIKGNAATLSAGISFTCDNVSDFEFKSSMNQDRRDADTCSNMETPYVDNFVSRNAFTEATLSNKVEHVCVESKVRGYDLGAASETCSFSRSITNGTGGNMFLQGAAIGNTTSILTAMQPVNGGACDSSASTSTASATNICDQHATNFTSTSTASATNICDQHATNFTQTTLVNEHEGEGFCFTGNFDAGISPNIKPSLNRIVKLVPKRNSGKQAKIKKTRDYPLESRVDPACKEFTSRPESPQPYSPMDMSPIPVNEIPKASDETLKQGGTSVSSEGTTLDKNHPPDKDLAYVRQQLNVGKNVKETHIDRAHGCPSEGSRTPQEESAWESETESYKSAKEDLELNTITASCCNFGSDGTTNFYSVSNNEDTSGTHFIFTSPSSAKSSSVRRLKAVNKSKEFDSFRCSATLKLFGAFTGSQHLKEPFQYDVKADLTCSQVETKLDFTTCVSDEVDHKPSNAPEASTVAQEPCEKWRLRGNEAYASGDPSKAEEYYTRGVRCVPKSEKSRGSHRSLMLCYSNRAAVRMSLGRLREAVKDCKLAAGIDPSFLRAHVRAANCYLALGEVDEALRLFKYCLHSGNGVSMDMKILKEASEGLQKAQKAAEGFSRSIETIQQGTFKDAEEALRSADEALTICLYSEKLLEIKAEALFVLQKYSKVIQLCQDQESLDSAERNSNATDLNGRYENPNSTSLPGTLYFRLWRCRLMLKSYFFLGKHAKALALLEKHESLRRGSDTLDSLIPFVAVVRELLRHKAAGNEAFQAENFERAVEHYTAALAFNTDSHHFTAICLCNRAAAYKACGKVTDSIADCNLAIALEKDYLKAISRRASLCESIRDYDQAAKDTRMLVSLLKMQADGSLKKSKEKSISSGVPIDLKQAQLQLSRLEDQAKKGTPLNMYLILGVETSASASDIKKAYRQAALKHHPDKAGQILAKCNSRRNETWKGIAEEIHRDADRLFKQIGEAYTILSDPAQRSRYDAEEEIRNMPKKYTSRTHYDEDRYPFNSKSRRQTKNHWKSHGYF